MIPWDIARYISLCGNYWLGPCVEYLDEEEIHEKLYSTVDSEKGDDDSSDCEENYTLFNYSMAEEESSPEGIDSTDSSSSTAPEETMLTELCEKLRSLTLQQQKETETAEEFADRILQSIMKDIEKSGPLCPKMAVTNKANCPAEIAIVNTDEETVEGQVQDETCEEQTSGGNVFARLSIGRRRIEAPTTDVKISSGTNYEQKSRGNKCKFYPWCKKGDDCKFFHPKRECR